jgi:rhodanese-related sulfurtransferase
MTTAKEMVDAAKAEVEGLSPAQVAAEVERGHALLVDVREPDETRKGVIPGAVLAPRGMLEFYADPDTPHHKPEFERNRRVVVYCAAGSRSALAARTLRDLGYLDVAHLDGGVAAWQRDDRPLVDLAEDTPGVEEEVRPAATDRHGAEDDWVDHEEDPSGQEE